MNGLINIAQGLHAMTRAAVIFAALATACVLVRASDDVPAAPTPLPRHAADPFALPAPTPSDIEVKTAVERGLRFIASKQNTDGSWTNDVGLKLGEGYRREAYQQPHVGVTALCVMALVAGGHTPESGEFSTNVKRGVRFVLEQVQPSGHIKANGTRMYSHAFASLMLAEIYGMTRDQAVKQALKDAVGFILENQVSAQLNPNRGGWRYEPKQQDADMSITVCQLQALRAARNVGVAVPTAAIEAARDYVLTNYNPSNGAFSYQPQFRYNRETFALTAAGVVALQSSGKYDSYRDEKRGIVVDFYESLSYLHQTRRDRTSGFNPGYCDYGFWYGHYYAAQAFHQYQYVNPKIWQDWNDKNRRSFLSMQQSNGAWLDEIGGTDKDKNAYATAMACLILSIPNGYLPIFQA